MNTFKQFLDESINDRGVLKAVFVVGIPGAGKSYTVSQLQGPIAPKVINTDRATEFLVKKFKIPANDQTWNKFFKDHTKLLTVEALYGYLNSMLPLFIDGTSNDASNILSRSGILESIGYDVGMVFINTSLDVAHTRVKMRANKINRHVDPDFIDHVHQLSLENKEYFKGKFKFFKEVNNDPGELDDKALLRIYKDVVGFYSKPGNNPVGNRIFEKLKTDKEKYLIPAIFDAAELKKKAESWYRT